MTWTKEKPTAPGWYWYQSNSDDVGDWSNGLFIIEVHHWMNQTTLRVAMLGSDVTYDLADARGLFFGPLSAPRLP